MDLLDNDVQRRVIEALHSASAEGRTEVTLLTADLQALYDARRAAISMLSNGHRYNRGGIGLGAEK